MRTQLTLVAAALATLLTSSAHAAVEANLAITAKYVPVSCTLAVSNAGSFAFGDVMSGSLHETLKTEIGTKQNTYTIDCPGPSAVALKITDNREGTESDVNGTIGTQHFGVSDDLSGNHIGYSTYVLGRDPVINGSTGRYLSTVNAGQSWTTNAGKYQLDHAPDYAVSFTDASGSAPVRVSTASGTVDATLFIDARSGLNTNLEFPVSGSATLELVYL